MIRRTAALLLILSNVNAFAPMPKFGKTSVMQLNGQPAPANTETIQQTYLPGPPQHNNQQPPSANTETVAAPQPPRLLEDDMEIPQYAKGTDMDEECKLHGLYCGDPNAEANRMVTVDPRDYAYDMD